MKIGDLVLVKLTPNKNWPNVSINSWTIGMITALDVLDYSGDCDPWTTYKVLVGDEIITTHTGKIKPWTKSMTASLNELANR